MYSDLHKSPCVPTIGSRAERDDRSDGSNSKKTSEADARGRNPGKRDKAVRVKSVPASRSKGGKETSGLMFPKTPVKKKRKHHPKSIINTNKRKCFLCGLYKQTEEHHIFGGSNRRLSEEYGLKVYLCPNCHQHSKYSAHRDKDTADHLHRVGQQAFEEQISSREEFMKIFGRNYL